VALVADASLRKERSSTSRRSPCLITALKQIALNGERFYYPILEDIACNFACCGFFEFAARPEHIPRWDHDS
jgi:hypothetical protein